MSPLPFPRYYFLGDEPSKRRYYRLSEGGVYHRWKDDEWEKVDGKLARDHVSRAIEGGEAVPLTLEEAAAAGLAVD